MTFRKNNWKDAKIVIDGGKIIEVKVGILAVYNGRIS